MASDGDLKAHERTYSGFTALLKWGAIAAFLTGLIVIFAISN
ncbi:aa3-type cytochrome c oxidase subunit IV [Sphingomonas sp.]|jgi:hypothetical protein|nr:aa3-type cytochrome c oxidase subunit IV [Sphingomonas sp.]HEU4969293.1 aa3-type cytochrome c oxidase subunit IV [Sphingomonas sp.]